MRYCDPFRSIKAEIKSTSPANSWNKRSDADPKQQQAKHCQRFLASSLSPIQILSLLCSGFQGWEPRNHLRPDKERKPVQHQVCQQDQVNRNKETWKQNKAKQRKLSVPRQRKVSSLHPKLMHLFTQWHYFAGQEKSQDTSKFCVRQYPWRQKEELGSSQSKHLDLNPTIRSFKASPC